MEAYEIKIVPPDDADLHSLIALLDEEMLTLYPSEGIYGVDFSDPKVLEMTFCVAYAGGKPAGCGALKPLGPGTAELKRFFVNKRFRGRGMASLILNFIEEKAREAGVRLIRLETGPKQPAAIGLYGKFGYVPTELYGEYTNSEYSYCMEKELP